MVVVTEIREKRTFSYFQLEISRKLPFFLIFFFLLHPVFHFLYLLLFTYSEWSSVSATFAWHFWLASFLYTYMHTPVPRTCWEQNNYLRHTEFKFTLIIVFHSKWTERTSFEVWLKKSLKCQKPSCCILITHVNLEDHRLQK